MEAGLPCKHILLTGSPGIGKTTVVRKVYERLKTSNKINVKGFYTEEIRSGGKRIGFDICCLDGRRGRLARIGSSSSGPKVGQYTVDLSSFENMAISALEVDTSVPTILFIDEIGKMELFSIPFRRVVEERFSQASNASTDLKILATIPMSKGRPLSFVEELKKRRDINIYTITRENRDEAVSDVAAKLMSN